MHEASRETPGCRRSQTFGLLSRHWKGPGQERAHVLQDAGLEGQDCTDVIEPGRCGHGPDAGRGAVAEPSGCHGIIDHCLELGFQSEF